MKYFVSYTTKDKEITQFLLESLAEKLKGKGKVFIDLVNNNSINKQERILTELDSCNVFLLIETKKVYESNWVKFELEKASSRKIPIKVLSIEDIKQIIESDDFETILDFH